ncbi:glycosyltransferase family 10 domain-containing protein [Roseovarius confluentis]|uniref:glycosyltransferase family 10 domain-containing protein n=1 Tax=Roseovarius confluentis TaxID=1852027 RepID=UPI000CDD51DA|nr:glycosyltransferase family 10 [Roseovarius confluentis]
MNETSNAIAIMPYDVRPGLRPGRVRLDALLWPMGRPERLAGAERTVRDLGPDDHLVVFTSSLLYRRPWLGTRAKVSVMILEPEAIHGDHMQKLRRQYARFHKVLTANADLLAAIPNGVLFPQGITWVGDRTKLDLTKTKACSLIASAKRSQEGHALRHTMVDYVRAEGLDVDVMGGGYQPFERKADGLAPYRFSLVIENVREVNYFTEKLIDAVLCKCVPIYWGCPNIADFIDTSGMIVCESEAELKAAMQDLSEERYAALLPRLEAAMPKAEIYGELYERAARAVVGD